MKDVGSPDQNEGSSAGASDEEAEIARLSGFYSSYSNRAKATNAGDAYNRRRHLRELGKLLRRHFPDSLQGVSILDVGTGEGDLLDFLHPHGARDEEFWGVDLMPDRIAQVSHRFPEAHFCVAGAHDLPFPDAQFDLVCQRTMLSSVLSVPMRQKIAAEMDRVLKPGGSVLWYDFWLNPLNSNTRGVRKHELMALFAGYALDLRQPTLAPPVARGVGPRLPALLPVLNAIRPLCTHYLAVLTKPARP